MNSTRSTLWNIECCWNRQRVCNKVDCYRWLCCWYGLEFNSLSRSTLLPIRSSLLPIRSTLSTVCMGPMQHGWVVDFPRSRPRWIQLCHQCVLGFIRYLQLSVYHQLPCKWRFYEWWKLPASRLLYCYGDENITQLHNSSDDVDKDGDVLHSVSSNNLQFYCVPPIDKNNTKLTYNFSEKNIKFQICSLLVLYLSVCETFEIFKLLQT